MKDKVFTDWGELCKFIKSVKWVEIQRDRSGGWRVSYSEPKEGDE